MPETSFTGYSSRNGYPSLRNKKVENKYPVYNVQKYTTTTTPTYDKEIIVQDSYIPQNTYSTYNNQDGQITYQHSNDKITYNHDNNNINNYQPNNNQQFVVGSVPKEVVQEVTPVAVPEHGPRFLKIRRRRSSGDFSENEIPLDDEKFDKSHQSVVTASSDVTTQPTTTVKPTKTTYKPLVPTVADEKPNFLNLLKDLINFKIRFGLELLQNTTMTFSRYLSRVQQRLDSAKDS